MCTKINKKLHQFEDNLFQTDYWNSVPNDECPNQLGVSELLLELFLESGLQNGENPENKFG